MLINRFRSDPGDYVTLVGKARFDPAGTARIGGAALTAVDDDSVFGCDLRGEPLDRPRQVGHDEADPRIKLARIFVTTRQ